MAKIEHRHTKGRDMGDVACGAEASRRVAFALMYEARDDCKKLLNHNRILLRHLAELALAIAGNETLAILEPDGELFVKARQALATIRLRAGGDSVLDELLRDEDL